MPAKRSGARRSFLGVRERPGTVVRRRVAVATWPDGSPLTLPILVATGAPGPALYVQGGLHGDEIVGVEAARQIVAAVRASEIRGTLVSVPIANPPAFMSRQRGWPFEARGPIDMNRVCPGDANGPLTARIARAIFDGILPSADYCLDFHGGMSGSSEAPFAQVVMLDDEHRTLAKRKLMAEAFGTVRNRAHLRDEAEGAGAARRLSRSRILVRRAGPPHRRTDTRRGARGRRTAS